MKKLDNTLFIFIVIALEGYIILSSELLAMRQMIPFIGSGTDIFAIVIAAVLMPVAFGYYSGGRFNIKNRSGNYRTIRKKLLLNIIIAAAFLLPALSYFILMFFFFGLRELGINNNIVQTTIYCLIFLVTPMYLLGQTIPLVSNYFSKEKLSRNTGRMLFISTMGSFAGSIVTTLVLMSLIGVNNSVIVIFAMLFILIIILGSKRTRNITVTMIMILIFSIILNSNTAMEILNIVKNNKYSTMIIMHDDEGTPHLQINGNDSSKYSKTGEKHRYIEFAERVAIDSIPKNAEPKNILIIGAGGFTFGHNDEKNNYIYIDIDKDLKEISEKYLLKEKLKDNKTFYPLPARAYLTKTDMKFDVILLDAYLGGLSIPEHLVTQEFFTEIKDHMNDKAVLVANFITSPTFRNKFSKNTDNTLRSVFPYISRHFINGDIDVLLKMKSVNSIYIYKHFENINNGSIFND